MYIILYDLRYLDFKQNKFFTLIDSYNAIVIPNIMLQSTTQRREAFHVLNRSYR